MKHLTTLVALMPMLALAATLNDGLVAWYQFDGNADDSSPNKNNGIVQGATLTTDRFGNANRAYAFNGDDWIEVFNSPSLQSVTNTMTFAAWVKPAPNCGWFLPVLCKGVAKRQFGLGLIRRSNTVFINDYMGTGSGKEVSFRLPSGTCNGNIWYHLAVSYDGKKMNVYVNGQNVGNVAVIDSYVANTAALYIGMDPPGANEFLNGTLDEIRIYNRVLSDKEIADVCTQESRNIAQATIRGILERMRPRRAAAAKK